MDETEVLTLLGRLSRMWRAVEVGCDVAVREDRPQVVEALADTVWEAIDIGYALTRLMAYDELLWEDLDLLVAQWHRIEGAALQVQQLDPTAIPAGELAGDARRCLRQLQDAVRSIERSQAVLRTYRGDREALAGLAEGAQDLEQVADRYFVHALSGDVGGRLDAALALLTASAARAGRERRSVARRG